MVKNELTPIADLLLFLLSVYGNNVSEYIHALIKHCNPTLFNVVFISACFLGLKFLKSRVKE